MSDSLFNRRMLAATRTLETYDFGRTVGVATEWRYHDRVMIPGHPVWSEVNPKCTANIWKMLLGPLNPYSDNVRDFESDDIGFVDFFVEFEPDSAEIKRAFGTTAYSGKPLGTGDAGPLNL
jgi:hypothetical protein